MAEAKKTQKTTTTKAKKISDVSKKAAASPASRAIIVNNRPILKDPMMAGDDAVETKPQPSEPEDAATKVEVKRLGKKIAPEATATAGKKESSKSEAAAKSDNSGEATDATADKLNDALRKLTGPKEKTTEEKAPVDDPAEDTPEEVKSEAEEKEKAEPEETKESAETEEPTETEAETEQPAVEETESPKEDTAKEEKPAEEKLPDDEPKEEPKDKPEETEESSEAEAETAEDSDQSPVKENSSSESQASSSEEAAPANTTDAEAEGKAGVNEKTGPKPSGRQLTAEQIKAIESGQYFLPIQTLDNRRAKRDLAIFLILTAVLVAVWLNVLLDAGLIELGGLKALTNFL